MIVTDLPHRPAGCTQAASCRPRYNRDTANGRMMPAIFPQPPPAWDAETSAGDDYAPSICTPGCHLAGNRSGERRSCRVLCRQNLWSAGPYSVSLVDLTWFDAERGRSVPVRIYYPTNDSVVGKFPLIVFSTGLGRSRDDCAYLGRHWASCGYVSVHVQHKGSDEEVRQGNLRPRKELQKAFYAPQNIRNRPLDIIFAIDRLEAMQREGSTPGDRCDLTRIGVAGHDFGARRSWPWPEKCCRANRSFRSPASRPSWP